MNQLRRPAPDNVTSPAKITICAIVAIVLVLVGFVAAVAGCKSFNR